MSYFSVFDSISIVVMNKHPLRELTLMLWFMFARYLEFWNKTTSVAQWFCFNFDSANTFINTWQIWHTWKKMILIYCNFRQRIFGWERWLASLWNYHIYCNKYGLNISSVANITTWSIGYGCLFGKTDFTRGDKHILVKISYNPRSMSNWWTTCKSIYLFIL